MKVNIQKEDPATPDIVSLLEKHLDLMRSISPPDSVHALDVEKLRQKDITFWTVRTPTALVGCGAMKELDKSHGEIKSMHVAQAVRGKGIAKQLVKVVLEEAKARNYMRLSLETGSTEHFQPARSLYALFGFKECDPFADYVADWHSVFMTKELF